MSINKIFLLSAGIFMSACSSDVFITHTGNMPSEDKIAMIFEGQRQQDVMEILGSPSTVVSLDKNTWIYMSSDIKQVAFMSPKEISRTLLVVKFTPEGTVGSFEKMNEEKGKKMQIAEEKTADQEQEQGFFRKYFGGVGQYLPFGSSKNNGMEP